MKDVNKDDFNTFVAAYPRPLHKNVSGISEPPTLTYNDFTRGNWPDSVVAQVMLFEEYPKEGALPYRWEPNTYKIEEV